MTFAALQARWTAFAATTTGRWTIKGVRWLFMLAIVGYLAYELTAIGWEAIWTSLPTTPWFYLLFVLLYFSLPVAEVFMYRVTWSFDGWRSLPAFIKKRVYNKDVLGYSGEVYFFAWARQQVDLSDAEIAKTIRDNNILSSVASTLVALGLLGVFLMAGEIRLGALLGDRTLYYVLGGLGVTALLAPVAIRFRRYLFSMAWRAAAIVFAIQVGRLVLGQVLQIAQWEVVMPEVSLSVWFTYAAVSIILTRIPFLPNQNLIFLGAGVELSGMMDISSASIAGMLLVASVLDKLMNLALFAAISLAERYKGRQTPSEAVSEPESRMAAALTAPAEAPAPVKT